MQIFNNSTILSQSLRLLSLAWKKHSCIFDTCLGNWEHDHILFSILALKAVMLHAFKFRIALLVLRNRIIHLLNLYKPLFPQYVSPFKSSL